MLTIDYMDKREEINAMKLNHLAKKGIALVLSLVFVFSLAGCGSSSKDKEEDETKTSETTTLATLETTPVTTTLREYGVSAVPNDVAVSWQESEITATTMYVHVTSGYLKVRKGPGTDYQQVAALSSGMQVIVVAKTSDNWYKLQDGFYTYGEYLSLTP